jgi:mono/diheme cytochrome c family protein
MSLSLARVGLRSPGRKSLPQPLAILPGERVHLRAFGDMPALRDRLGDNGIAAIATFIRNSRGNDFGVPTS